MLDNKEKVVVKKLIDFYSTQYVEVKMKGIEGFKNKKEFYEETRKLLVIIKSLKELINE